MVDFSDQLNNSISSSFNKRSKRQNAPFYYSSHTMHSLNLVKTLRRKCIKNPSHHNFVLVTKAEEDLSDSIELDRLCFLNGTATNSTTECFKAVRSLSVQSLPQQMHFGKLKFCSEISIANGFNMLFTVTTPTNELVKFTASHYSLRSLYTFLSC